MPTKGSNVSVLGVLGWHPDIIMRTIFGKSLEGLLWGCTVSEKKAVRCCRSHGSTVRVVSMLAMLLRSFPLHHVSAEQQVTELPPVCQARSLFPSPLEKLSLMGGAGRAPRG